MNQSKIKSLWNSLPEVQPFLRSGVFFVQVGSHDGKDDLTKLVKNHCWKGMLIEPNPVIFPLLKKTYADQDMIFENVAIDPQKNSVELFHIKKGEKVNWKWSTLHKDRFLPRKGRSIHSSTICKACTLTSLLIKHKIEQFDWLHIDVEAHDYQVLLSLDLDKYQPHIIIWERKHLIAQDSQKMDDLFISRGYTVKQISRMNRMASK
ncbi:hypothetical protein LCGC14_1688490 [marine sediment metagenome]|uniref:Methyltransferase FkbM domain-containing protein n=1 Tax=marine sediment metagenome TaxID=412755 RepID=A0A0F9I925_9ZZZZ